MTKTVGSMDWMSHTKISKFSVGDMHGKPARQILRLEKSFASAGLGGKKQSEIRGFLQ